MPGSTYSTRPLPWIIPDETAKRDAVGAFGVRTPEAIENLSEGGGVAHAEGL